jgi:hypothetical protein
MLLKRYLNRAAIQISMGLRAPFYFQSSKTNK